MEYEPEKKIAENASQEESRDKRSVVDTAVMAFFFGGLIIAIAAGFARFYFAKEYDFFIETPCDTEMEWCFVRDCSSEDSECPPNGFESFRQFSMTASDYDSCEADLCEMYCEGSNNCSEIICDEETEECEGVKF